MKRIRLTFVVLIAIMFLVYFAGRGTRVSDARAENRSQISPPSGVRDFTLKDLEGHDESLGQLGSRRVARPIQGQNRSREFLGHVVRTVQSRNSVADGLAGEI